MEPRRFDGARSPLLGPALAFSVGCAVVGGGEPYAALMRVLCVVAAGCVGCLALRDPRAGRSALPFAFAGLGFAFASAAADDVSSAPTDGEETPTLVRGTVANDPERGPDITRFDVAAATLKRAGADEAWSGRVRVSVRGAVAEAMGRGDEVEAWVDLRAPRPRRSPGGFDEAAWARREGLAALASCKSPRLVRVLSRARGSGADRAVWALRMSVRAAFERLPPGPERAVAISTVLGDTGELTPEVESTFRSSGLLHVLVVSGAQVAILVLIVRGALPRRFRIQWRGWFIESAAVVLYCFVSGAQDSVVRASVMALAVGVAARLDLRTAGMNGLSAAALIVFTARPLDVLDPGAQLSFAVAGALIRFGSPATRALREARFPGVIADLVGSAAVATAAATPVVWMRFDSLPAAAPIANIVAAPLAAGLLCATVALLSATLVGLDAIVAPVVLGLSRTLIEVAEGASALDLEWRGPGPELLTWAALAAVGRLACSHAAARIARVGCAWLAFALCGSGAGTGDGRLHVFFLDVGQGDATLIVTPNGRGVLVDAGPAFGIHDAGRSIVAPAAWAAGLRRLAALALTHPHADHEGGARSVSRMLSPAETWLGPRHENPAAVRAVVLTAGNERVIDGIRFRVLWPGAADARNERDVNARSLILEARWGGVDVLLLGDAPFDVQRRFDRALTGQGRRSIVKVAHHGSATAGFWPWGGERPPDHAVVSAGRGNRFGHPAPPVTRAWARGGSLVHRTDRAGSLHVATDGARVWSAAVFDPVLRVRR